MSYPVVANGSQPDRPDWRAIAAALAWAQSGERHTARERQALALYDAAVRWETARNSCEVES